MPAIAPLLPHQKRWVEDKSRFKYWAASVQTGKSHGISFEQVLERIEIPKLSILLSASDRQSMELMEKVKMHTRAMGIAAKTSTGFFEQSSIVQHTATFPNGSRIIALPANPDTARGYTGDVVLDEFALHRDSKAIWAAMFTRVTRGHKLRVASTYKGTENKFYELGKSLGLVGLFEGWRPAQVPNQVGEWSGHFTDIHMAVEEGLKVDILKLKTALGDEDIWLQDYCCVPIDGAAAFISEELVMTCESEEASIDFSGAADGELYAGMDIGRKRDLSTIWILARVEDRLITRGVITMDRQPFAQQRETARAIAPLVSRFSIDATGIGAMLAEELHAEFPWVEQVSFTAPVKERMATEVKAAMESRSLLIPENAKIRRAIGAVKRFVGATGVIRFDAARTDQGHADEFWALALAKAAASNKSYVPVSEGGAIGDTVVGNVMERVF